MLLKIKLILLSLVLTLLLQNEQGNTLGSLFIKISECGYFHLHHWILSIMLLLIIEFCFKENSFKHILGNIIIGFGLGGFLAYSDRFDVFTKCSINCN